MRVPDGVADAFIAAQKQYFEDTTVDWYAESITTDSHNSKYTAPAAVKSGTLADCSVGQGIDDAEMMAWGLVPGQDIVINDSDVFPFTVGQFVKYGSRYYRVTGIQTNTLSNTAFCSLWKK